jgi:hypothetical protein
VEAEPVGGRTGRFCLREQNGSARDRRTRNRKTTGCLLLLLHPTKQKRLHRREAELQNVSKQPSVPFEESFEGKALLRPVRQEIFVGRAYEGKDIVFGFIIEYSSLMDFGPYVIDLFLYEDF